MPETDAEMIIHVDELGDVLCLQIPKEQLACFADVLSHLREGMPAALRTTEGGEIAINLTTRGSKIDIRQSCSIRIYLTRDMSVKIAHKIYASIDQECEDMLDISLESYGCDISPESIRDVVLETRKRADSIPD